MINLKEVGAYVFTAPNGQPKVHFGLYLRDITYQKGYEVVLRIIHEEDQFTPGIEPLEFYLECHDDHPYDLWDITLDLYHGPNLETTLNRAGTYLYRYMLLRNKQVVTLWFTDPFARATGIGQLAAFTTPREAPDFTWTDQNFRVPELDDLIVYELQVEEFNSTFEGVIERLDYLKGLGVNALELMPVTSVQQEFDWGYGPLHFFAPEERWGGELGLKKLVNACHSKGIAVILDSVYEHVDSAFAYERVYADSGEPNPMIGHFVDDPNNSGYGSETDFTQSFTCEFFEAANAHWLNEYHVDGFRYDYVPGYYDGPEGKGYASLVYRTYQTSLTMPRFLGSNGADPAAAYSRIIQCAENLDHPRRMLRETYSNAVWQNELLDKACDMARNNSVDDAFVHLVIQYNGGYPATQTMNGVEVPVAPFQYLETHDHSRFITQFKTLPPLGKEGDVVFGDRNVYYRIQPYTIALYTCQGIPMLWQGQEFAENYTLPAGGNLRISFRRSVHWEYFYDEPGKKLVRLHRILGQLRQTHRALRSRDSYYDNEHSKPGEGIVIYHRKSPAANHLPQEIAVVVLNFSDTERQIEIPFPIAGTYREMIDATSRAQDQQYEIRVDNDGEKQHISVPSHYGWIFLVHSGVL